jgi:hypothetical protein
VIVATLPRHERAGPGADGGADFQGRLLSALRLAFGGYKQPPH